MVLYMFMFILFFFFKQKTAYEMRISDWSSDVCSSDLISAAATPFRAGWRSHRHGPAGPFGGEVGKPDSLYAGGHDPFQPDGLSHRSHDQPCANTLRRVRAHYLADGCADGPKLGRCAPGAASHGPGHGRPRPHRTRPETHTSELPSLMRNP